jgi:cytochrome c oxidase subunit 2
MALPATKVLVAQKDTTNADLTIKATGYQWKWGYDYLKGEGEGIGFISTLDSRHRAMSDSRQARARATTTCSRWTTPWWCRWARRSASSPPPTTSSTPGWCRPFGVKQDAIPGFVRDTWFRAEKVGDFYGQCAELCGKEHAYMPIHVKVLSAQDYSQWVADQQKKDGRQGWTTRQGLDAGRPGGAWREGLRRQLRGLPPGQRQGRRPDQALDGSAVVLDADKAKQMQVLLKGVNNGAMPAWKQLSDTEIAAVITYTKNNWSNKTGQLVQPAECGRTQVITAPPSIQGIRP